MHSKDKFVYVKLNLDEKDQVDFLARNLRQFYTSDVLRWQYNQFAGHSGLYLTKFNDEYIASQGMIPITLIVNTHRILSSKSETSFLLPMYRGQGLFEQLYNLTIEKAEEDNSQLIWGFTELSKVWRNKLNFTVYDGLITESELQLNFSNLLYSNFSSEYSIVEKLKRTAKGVITMFRNRKLPKLSEDYETREIDAVNQSEIQNVLKKWTEHQGDYVRIDTNPEYLSWRISKNPIMKYRALGVYKNGALKGYAIVNKSYHKSYLLEFIVAEINERESCLISIAKYMKTKSEITHLVYWASNKNDYCTQIHSLFQKYGAKSYPNFNMNFVVKNTKNISFDSSDISQFYINGLWTEGFNI